MSASPVDRETVTLDPSGGIPVVEVYFGQAQAGRFNLYLQDPSKQQTKVGSAGTASGGEIASVSVGKKASDLNNWWICIDITVMAPTGGDGQRYLAVTSLKQDGNSLISVEQSDDFSGNSESLLVYLKCQ